MASRLSSHSLKATSLTRAALAGVSLKVRQDQKLSDTADSAGETDREEAFGPEPRVPENSRLVREVQSQHRLVGTRASESAMCRGIRVVDPHAELRIRVACLTTQLEFGRWSQVCKAL